MGREEGGRLIPLGEVKRPPSWDGVGGDGIARCSETGHYGHQSRESVKQSTVQQLALRVETIKEKKENRAIYNCE